MSSALTNQVEFDAIPALVDPPKPLVQPHPVHNPCTGCPRQHGPNLICKGPIVLNEATKRAHWRGTLLPLTKAEFNVMAKLVMGQGHPVNYRAIYDVVQKPGFVAGTPTKGFDNGCHTNVRSMIKRIRKKFLAVDPTFDAIGNYIGVGYAWKEE